MGNFSPKLKSRYFFVTVQIGNFINAGLTDEQYRDYEFLSKFLVNRWQDSGEGRYACCTICISHKDGKECYHVHFVAWADNPTTLGNVSKIMYKSHTEPCLGGRKALKEYILKEGKFVEKGEDVLYTYNVDQLPEIEKGHRSDLDDIADLLSDGLTPSQIYDCNFKYRRYEKMIMAAYLEKRIKETPLQKEMHNEYHWGASGTGKTYTYIKLCEEYGEDNVYLVNDYQNGGFDTYNNAQDIVVLDEFRGNLHYSYLLTLLDRYSRFQVHCRFANRYALWTRTILISILPIEEIYQLMVPEERRRKDKKVQLIRRFDEIIYHYKNEAGEYCEYRLPADEYVDAQDMISRAKASEQSEEIKTALKDFGATPIKNDKQ